MRTKKAANSPVDGFAPDPAVLKAGTAIAVSGGGDSLALMRLLAEHAHTHALPAPVVVTVDHALRPGSAAEAARVCAWAEDIGLQAVTLTRKGPPPKTDIEARARVCRYRLIGAWCREAGLPTVTLAHTLDDQAETFLLRLLRGSGVDGLSAMRPLAPYPLPGFAELRLWRPLLGARRAALRTYLSACGQTWLEDPMNEDPRFARVRLRQAWPTLEALGFDAKRLAETASHLGRARLALEVATDALRRRATHPCAAGLLVEAAMLAAAPEEIGLRVLADGLMEVSGQGYRPRFERLKRLYDTAVAGTLTKACTLHGCRIAPAPRRHRHAMPSHFGARLLLIGREAGRDDRAAPIF